MEKKEDWNYQLSKSPAATPFLTHEWLSSCLRSSGRGQELFILVATSPDSPHGHGLAPLLRTKTSGFSTIQFIGSGYSDYQDFIISEKPDETVAAFLGLLADRKDSWDIIDLKDILPFNRNLERIARGARNEGWRVFIKEYSSLPYLPINTSWEKYLARQSSNFRYTLKRNERRVVHRNLRLEIHKVQSGKIEKELVDRMTDIESHSWKAGTAASKIQTEHQRSFYLDFLNSFARSGWLDLWFLSIDGQPVAYQINFDYGNKIWFYNSAFDDRYKKLSPGSLLMQKAVREAFLRGRREFDFMKGTETYKGRWASEQRTSFQILICQPTLRSALAYLALNKLRRYGQRLRRVFPWPPRLFP